MGLEGLEPSTSRLSVVCSSQLSYKPEKVIQSLKTEQQDIEEEENLYIDDGLD